MPYKYIGRPTNFKGKTLWEIVGNLKNFGVGRVVVRHRHLEKYPEASFFRILKVEPQPAPEVENMDNVRKVRVHTDAVFRGKPLPSPFIIDTISYKADYQLVPKDQEDKYTKLSQPKENPNVIYPKVMEFPPLLKELLIRDLVAEKPDARIEEPKLEIAYNTSSLEERRIAKDGEVPTIKFHVGLGDAMHKSPMYKDLKEI